jgi:phage shock protein PspC (stress-responsive transcriptional regulator)
MKTKLLMTSSALFCGIIGTLLLFLPIEIAEYLGVEPTIITILFLKILSAIYLGFGILNWTAKGTLIGGIYNKPIVLGNLLHFAVGAIELIKVISSIQTHREIIIFLTVFYVIFALLFVYVIKTNPT